MSPSLQGASSETRTMSSAGIFCVLLMAAAAAAQTGNLGPGTQDQDPGHRLTLLFPFKDVFVHRHG